VASGPLSWCWPLSLGGIFKLDRNNKLAHEIGIKIGKIKRREQKKAQEEEQAERRELPKQQAQKEPN